MDEINEKVAEILDAALDDDPEVIAHSEDTGSEELPGDACPLKASFF